MTMRSAMLIFCLVIVGCSHDKERIAAMLESKDALTVVQALEEIETMSFDRASQFFPIMTKLYLHENELISCRSLLTTGKLFVIPDIVTDEWKSYSQFDPKRVIVKKKQLKSIDYIKNNITILITNSDRKVVLGFALQTIGEMGPYFPEAGPLVERYFEDTDPKIAEAALIAYWNIDPEKSLSRLYELQQSKNTAAADTSRKLIQFYYRKIR